MSSTQTKAPPNTQHASIFGRFSNFYFLVFGQTLEHGRVRVGELLKRLKPANVLEVGVGTGLTFKHYPDGTNLEGIDINQPMLDRAKERATEFPKLKISVQCMDATHMTFANNSFDLTYAPSVLSVVNDAKSVFKEMIRVTKSGGTIIAICYARKPGATHKALARMAGPLTEKYLGFHMRLESNFFDSFSEVEMLSTEGVNYVGPWPLSTMFVLKKL